MKTSLTTLLSFIFLIFISYSYAQNNTLAFDGSEDYILCNANSAANISDNTISIEAWIYPTAFNSAAYQNSIVGNDYWGSGTSEGYVFRFGGINGDLDFTFGKSSPDGWYSTTATNVLNLNSWQHVAAVYNGSTVKIYVNGIEEKSNSVSYNINPSSQNLNISRCPSDPGGRLMNGKIDELRIWSDARSLTELRQNMHIELNGNEDGLVAYYPFNETSGTTTNDASGNSGNGTLYHMDGTEWFTSPAIFGPKNNLAFDGSNDYITIPSDASLNNNAYSVEFWVYYNGQPSFYTGIIDKGRDIGGGNGNDWWFLTVPGEAGIFGCTGTELWYSIEYNKWTHIAGTYDGSTMKVYVNGILQNSQSKAYTASSNGIVIGRRTSGSSYFKGNLDEVRIWNTSRTAQQIRENMNKSLSGNENGLVAYYNLDNLSGTTLQDFSGNNNDGSLNNMDNSDWVSSAAFNTWLNTNSTLWSASSNWSRGSVPGSTDNVHIEQLTALPTNSSDLTVNNFVLVSSSSLDFTGSMTINGNAFFYSPYTIYSGKGMTVEGNFFFDDSKSTAFTVKSGGSLITNGNVSGSISLEKTISESSKWHLISMPNSNTTTSDFTGYYLQEWDELSSNWIEITNLGEAMPPCNGYGLWDVPAKNTFLFSGTPNTGEQSINIYSNSTVEDTTGMNLIGNPYPSSIDLDVIDPDYGAFHVWNPTGDDYEEYNNGTGNIRYLAPMQGFFVYAQSNGTFTIDNDARTHTGASTFYKSKSYGIENGLVLSTNQQDKLYIKLMNEANDDFDFIYDAYKIVSLGNGNSQLYSKNFDTKLAIDCRPETENIQLGYQNNQNGTYTIELQDSDGITAELEDTKLNYFHNFSKGAYSFDWNTTDSEERFILHLKATGTENEKEQDAQVYAANGQLYIRMNQENQFDQLVIYDLAGRVITEKTIQAQDLQSIDLNHLSGAYLIQLKGSNNSLTKKIIMK